MYSILQVKDRKNSSGYREFIIDTVEDVATLPTSTTKGEIQVNREDDNKCCAIGSVAFVIADSSVYMLGNDNQWHKI